VGSQYYCINKATGSMVFPCNKIDTKNKIIEFSNHGWDTSLRFLTDVTIFKDLNNRLYEAEDKARKFQNYSFYTAIVMAGQYVEQITMREDIDPDSFILHRDYGQNQPISEQGMTPLNLAGGNAGDMNRQQYDDYKRRIYNTAKKNQKTSSLPQYISEEDKLRFDPSYKKE
jgi:hypothetical protein